MERLNVTSGNFSSNLKSHLFDLTVDLYNSMGDTISMQYGGSIAHHSQLQKSDKKFISSMSEYLTSIKRHLNNNLRDPLRQSIINVFVGVYRPQTSQIEIDGERTVAPISRIQEIPEFELQLHSREAIKERYGFDRAAEVERRFWWERYLCAFEDRLPF